jgi:FkbM family methyltransferase
MKLSFSFYCFFLTAMSYALQAETNPLPFSSQLGQDKYILENFFKKPDGTYITDGFFIEIGAYDGRIFSNTYVLESLGWKGICVEPVPEIFDQLKNNRTCICIQSCISDKEGTTLFRQVCDHEVFSGIVEKTDPRHIANLAKNYSTADLIYYEVPCTTLSTLIQTCSIIEIHVLSIDTEGGELDILRSLSDKELALIYVICVEDNYNNQEFIEFLTSKNFQFITRMRQDLIFVNKDYMQQPPQ